MDWHNSQYIVCFDQYLVGYSMQGYFFLEWLSWGFESLCKYWMQMIQALSWSHSPWAAALENSLESQLWFAWLPATIYQQK